MLSNLYQSLTASRKQRVKVYGCFSFILALSYLSIFIFAINNKSLASLDILLTVFAGIGITLSIFAAIALFTLFVAEKDNGGRANTSYLLLAALTFFLPILPIVCLAYSGYRRNNQTFRISAGVITFLHTILFNSVFLSVFDPIVTEDAFFIPVYLLGFLSFLLIIARFIKYLPVSTLDKIYKFFNIKS